ncbi:MAG: hypothetical protein JJT78_13495 [Leptospira sp.]|nr:hypothetical protein [Leptospira sp.]
MRVPLEKEAAIELCNSLKKTLGQLEEENENPILIFRSSMKEGYLFNPALKDATNALTVYANIYQSIKELEEIIELKNW